MAHGLLPALDGFLERGATLEGGWWWRRLPVASHMGQEGGQAGKSSAGGTYLTQEGPGGTLMGVAHLSCFQVSQPSTLPIILSSNNASSLAHSPLDAESPFQTQKADLDLPALFCFVWCPPPRPRFFPWRVTSPSDSCLSIGIKSGHFSKKPAQLASQVLGTHFPFDYISASRVCLTFSLDSLASTPLQTQAIPHPHPATRFVGLGLQRTDGR